MSWIFATNVMVSIGFAAILALFGNLQGGPLIMAMLFWYLVKSDWSGVRYCTLHWTSPFLQVFRTTRPCLSGLVVWDILTNIKFRGFSFEKKNQNCSSNCFQMRKQVDKNFIWFVFQLSCPWSTWISCCWDPWPRKTQRTTTKMLSKKRRKTYNVRRTAILCGTKYVKEKMYPNRSPINFFFLN